jgi:hypothetical protein
LAQQFHASDLPRVNKQDRKDFSVPVSEEDADSSPEYDIIKIKGLVNSPVGGEVSSYGREDEETQDGGSVFSPSVSTYSVQTMFIPDNASNYTVTEPKEKAQPSMFVPKQEAQPSMFVPKKVAQPSMFAPKPVAQPSMFAPKEQA